MAEERDRLRTTFDEAASLYNETYDAEGYLRVLNTYSGHRSLNDDTRERLFRGIADLIDNRFDGRIVKGYLTTLYVAKRK